MEHGCGILNKHHPRQDQVFVVSCTHLKHKFIRDRSVKPQHIPLPQPCCMRQPSRQQTTEGDSQAEDQKHKNDEKDILENSGYLWSISGDCICPCSVALHVNITFHKNLLFQLETVRDVTESLANTRSFDPRRSRVSFGSGCS